MTVAAPGVPWWLFSLAYVLGEAGRLTCELRARGKALPWDVRCSSEATATWCPRCGSCTCRRDLDTADERCAMHGRNADHAEGAG